MSRFTPAASLAALLVLAGCGSSAAPAAPNRPAAVGVASSNAGSLVHLPQDQAAHPASANEWWYVVGHLFSGVHRFGYEMTVFRVSHVRPPGAAPGSPPVTLYRTDLAITDQRHKVFHQKLSYYFPQSARMSSSTLHVHVGNASLSGATPASMQLGFTMPGGSARLHLASQRPAMAVGGRGYLRFSNGFTYYYSLTDLATTGKLTLGGRRYAVKGTSWLDHQWGNWSWLGVRGWTWMALQLSNNTQLSVFNIRSPSGPTPGASVLLTSGKLVSLRDVRFRRLGTWTSPHTRAVYPSGFVVTIPAMKARLTVVPTVKDQELWLPAQPRGSYWEGSATVTGTWGNRPVTGLAYTELTGYAS